MAEVGKALGVHRNAVSQAASKNSLIKKTYLVTKKNMLKTQNIQLYYPLNG